MRASSCTRVQSCTRREARPRGPPRIAADQYGSLREQVTIYCAEKTIPKKWSRATQMPPGLEVTIGVAEPGLAFALDTFFSAFPSQTANAATPAAVNKRIDHPAAS